MMHTFWLQRKPDLPPAPAVPPALAAAARIPLPGGLATVKSQRLSMQRRPSFHPSNGPHGVAAAEAMAVLGIASTTSQPTNYVGSGVATGSLLGAGHGSCRPSDAGSSTDFVRRVTNTTNGGGLTPPPASGAGGYAGGYGACGGYSGAAATATAATMVVPHGTDDAGSLSAAADLLQSGMQAAVISAAGAGAQHQPGLAGTTQCRSPLGRKRSVSVHSYTSPSPTQQQQQQQQQQHVSRQRLPSAQAPTLATGGSSSGQAPPGLSSGTAASVLAAAMALGPHGQHQQQLAPAPTAETGLLAMTSSAASLEDIAFPVAFDPPIADARNPQHTGTRASNLLTSAAEAAAFNSAGAATSADPLGAASSPDPRMARRLLGAAVCDACSSGECELAITGGSVSRGGAAEHSSLRGLLRPQQAQQVHTEGAHSGGGAGGADTFHDEAAPLGLRALGLSAFSAMAEDAGVAMDVNATFAHSAAHLHSSTIISRLGSTIAIAGGSESGHNGAPGGAGVSNTSAAQFSFGLAGVLCSGQSSGAPGSVGPPFRRRQRILAGLDAVVSAAGDPPVDSGDAPACAGGDSAATHGDGSGSDAAAGVLTPVTGFAARANANAASVAGDMTAVKGNGPAAFLRIDGIGGGGNSGGDISSSVGSRAGAAPIATRAVAALSDPTDMTGVAQAEREAEAHAAKGKTGAVAADCRS